MKVLKVIGDMVEIFWVDDNEIEFMCIDAFIAKYGIEKLPKNCTNKIWLPQKIVRIFTYNKK